MCIRDSIKEVPPGNGIIYEDPEQLVQTLQHIMVQKNRISEGAKARKFVEEHCDWAVLTISFEKLLASITSLNQ